MATTLSDDIMDPPEQWYDECDPSYRTHPFTREEWCTFARAGIWVNNYYVEPNWSVEGAHQFEPIEAHGYPLMNAFIKARVDAGDPLYERLAAYIVRLRLLEQSDTL